MLLLFPSSLLLDRSLNAVVLLNRVTRIGPVVLVAALGGRLFPGWLRRHERLVLPAYIVAWTVFYAIYWR